ncbi:MAG TPA: hypothetical protein VIT46_10135, partial [Gaiellaceae bacterium]
MNARRNGFTSRGAIATIGAAALVLAALVAVIGSAQAAPSKKTYGATVDLAAEWTAPEAPATTSSATLRLSLANDARSNQTIGSANFVAPSGVEIQTVPPETPTGRNGWTVETEGTNVLAFRSTSNPLKPSNDPTLASVYADVVVSIDSAECGDAT